MTISVSSMLVNTNDAITGFNAAPLGDFVAMHPGIVGRNDGVADSDLDGQYRFDNPIATVLIERID